MTLLRHILGSDTVYRIGWALLHSVWQGAVIAAILSVVLWSLRRRSPNARYVAACLALMAMTAAPAVTFWFPPAPATHSSPGGVPAASVSLGTLSPSESPHEQ